MNIVISNSSESPIYRQIVDQIKEQIISGELAPGSALPSIRSLAKGLHISVITTKRAYDELESEGFIDSVGGKGTFVAHQNSELLHEMRMRVVEERLSEAISEARSLGITLDQLIEMVRLLHGEE